MPRTLWKKEEAPVRVTAPAPMEQAEPATTSVPLEKRAKARRSEKATSKPGSGRMLRGSILLFSGLGIFAFLVPVATGVPLNEYLQGADFKKAYGGANLHFLRGSAALKLGNLSAANQVLMGLPPETTEAHDLANAVFPQVLNARDYVTAARICQHMLPNTHPDARAVVNIAEVGKHMVSDLGLEKSLALMEKEPALKAQEQQLIPTIFAVAMTSPSSTRANNLAILEKLTHTLSGLSKTEAIKTIVTQYSNTNNLRAAWDWSLKLPSVDRLEKQKEIIYRFANSQPGLTLDILKTLGTGADQDPLRVAAVQGMLMITYAGDKITPADTQRFNTQRLNAKQLLSAIQTPEQRELALKAFVEGGSVALPEKLTMLDQIKDPKLKMDALLYVNRQSTPKDTEQITQPKLTAFVRQHPEFTKTHDEMMRYLAIRSNDAKSEERFISAMLDPATRIETQQEWKAGRLNQANVSWGSGQLAIMRPVNTKRLK